MSGSKLSLAGSDAQRVSASSPTCSQESSDFDDESDTLPPLGCPNYWFEVPSNDTTLTTLSVIESDLMDCSHFEALAAHMRSREVGTDRTGVGFRRKR